MSRAAYSYRADPLVPPFPDDKPLIVFDGDCVLCSDFARFVMARDPHKQFRLTVTQSALGQGLYRHLGLRTPDYDTNLLLEDGIAYVKSESSIRILARLGFPWSLIQLWRLMPLTWRDRMYGVIARNRIRWFGARPVCYRPERGEEDRFV